MWINAGCASRCHSMDVTTYPKESLRCHNHGYRSESVDPFGAAVIASCLRTMPRRPGGWCSAWSWPVPGPYGIRPALRLLLAFVRRVRTQPPTPRPSLVGPDGMNQEGEPVKVDVLERVSRKTHHMLLFFSLPPARASPGRHSENPVSFLLAAGHGSTPR